MDQDITSRIETTGLLQSWSAIRVGGKDRVEFLQGQLTQDIAAVTPDKPALAGWANNKGRLLCVGWVCDWQESLWLLLPAERREAVAQRLQMFVLRAEVTIELPDTAVHFAKISPHNSEKNNITNCFFNDYFYHFQLGDSSGVGLILGEWPTANKADKQSSALDADTAWRAWLIDAGIPAIYDATAESFVPQMVNLDLLGGISFQKGCYVGQEIVARTHNLGRIKRRMFAFSCATPLGSPGDEIYAGGDVAGSVVDSVQIADTQKLLGVIKLSKRNIELRLGTPQGPALNLARLPYVVPVDE